MNKVFFHGRLTRDPLFKQVGNTNICEFGLVSNRKFKDEAGNVREESTFVDLVAFSHKADIISKYAKKGDKLIVEGRLRYETWEAKDGGGKRSKLTVVVDDFDFGEKRGGGDSDQSAPEEEQPQQPQRVQEKTVAAPTKANQKAPW